MLRGPDLVFTRPTTILTSPVLFACTGERCSLAMDPGIFWAFGSPGSGPSNETTSNGGRGACGRLMPSMMEEVKIKLAAQTSKGPVGATCQAVYVARAKMFRWT